MRQVIKAIDIQVFFGKGESISFKMLRNIKKHYNKTNHQPITIDEFCKYFGINKEELIPIIQQNEAIKTQKLQKLFPIAQKPMLDQVPPKSSKSVHVPYSFS